LAVLTENQPKTRRKVSENKGSHPDNQKQGGNGRILFVLLCGVALSLYMLSKPPSDAENEPNQVIPTDGRQKKSNTLLFEEVVKVKFGNTIQRLTDRLDDMEIR
jgi:hypothetical protein